MSGETGPGPGTRLEEPAAWRRGAFGSVADRVVRGPCCQLAGWNPGDETRTKRQARQEEPMAACRVRRGADKEDFLAGEKLTVNATTGASNARRSILSSGDQFSFHSKKAKERFSERRGASVKLAAGLLTPQFGGAYLTHGITNALLGACSCTGTERAPVPRARAETPTLSRGRVHVFYQSCDRPDLQRLLGAARLRNVPDHRKRRAWEACQSGLYTR